MGQLITRSTGRIEKKDTNPDYQTYGDGDAYAIDVNGEYQSSDFNEVEEKDDVRGTRRVTPPKQQQQQAKRCCCLAIFCLALVAVGLAGGGTAAYFLAGREDRETDTTTTTTTMTTTTTKGCGDLLKPEVVQSTAFSSLYSASHVLVLAEVDVGDQNGEANFWLAEGGKTTGQGFTLQVGVCKSLIAGCQIKNKGRELISGVWNNWWSTKEFRVSGSMNANGPWETLLEDRLVDTTFSGGNRPALLLDFIFQEQVEIQFLKFELISFWGSAGGGLQYFAAIPA